LRPAGLVFDFAEAGIFPALQEFSLSNRAAMSIFPHSWRASRRTPSRQKNGARHSLPPLSFRFPNNFRTRFRNVVQWIIVIRPLATNGRTIVLKPPLPKIPKKNVRIYSENYLIRTLRIDDASDRWADWMLDPHVMHMMNMPARHWTKSHVVNYISQFDQRSRLLLGIFAKQTSSHIGVLTIELRPAPGEFLVNMLIGEPEYRNKGVATEITVPFRDYLFETLGLTTMRATVLAHNAVINHYLRKTGWKLDGTIKGHVKSHSDGTMLDLCLYSIAREEWRAWKARSLARES
jgi:RimJ/RimL family protein N-acetyltransferase